MPRAGGAAVREWTHVNVCDRRLLIHIGVAAMRVLIYYPTSELGMRFGSPAGSPSPDPGPPPEAAAAPQSAPTYSIKKKISASKK